MSSLRQIKTKMKSVQFIEKLANAMRFTSQVAVQRNLSHHRVLLEHFEAEKEMFACAWRSNGGSAVIPPYMSNAPEDAPDICIVLGPEQGFCGAMSDRLMRHCLKGLREKDILWVIGANILKRFKSQRWRVDVNFATRKESKNYVADLVQTFCKNHPVRRVFCVYPYFQNILTWSVEELHIKPFNPTTESSSRLSVIGDTQCFWKHAVHRYICACVESARMHTQMSEHSARMTAMDKAANNANDLVDELRLDWQRCRQALVTRELLEVTAGAIAIEDIK
ncbi:MAG: F0F1 ATP synthase subunit gamma [Alphaproteobacteria bacterium]|nr:F0F1 ATP synthase subunit gamma [Alphaproteobacteria bacterium]